MADLTDPTDRVSDITQYFFLPMIYLDVLPFQFFFQKIWSVRLVWLVGWSVCSGQVSLVRLVSWSSQWGQFGHWGWSVRSGLVGWVGWVCWSVRLVVLGQSGNVSQVC